MKPLLELINRTYGSGQLAGRLFEDLRSRGLDVHQLTTDDLISFDELHVMGRQATLSLGRLAGLNQDMHVLDVGCGLGGSVRTFTQNFGCRATGVDLSYEFVHTADRLSDRVGLMPAPRFCRAGALALPFSDNTFDAVFMIHVNMNIADKTGSFCEALRVLKAHSPLVLWEICSAADKALIYPVPWADDETFNRLVPMHVMADHLRNAGFEDLQLEDSTGEAVAWVQQRLSSSKNPHKRRPVPDLDLILNKFRLKRSNLSQNLLEGNIRIVRGLCRKGYPDEGATAKNSE